MLSSWTPLTWFLWFFVACLAAFGLWVAMLPASIRPLFRLMLWPRYSVRVARAGERPAIRPAHDRREPCLVDRRFSRRFGQPAPGHGARE